MWLTAGALSRSTPGPTRPSETLPAQRAEFECGGSPGVELIWIAGDTGYVISGEPAVVELMAETFTVK